MKRLACFLSIVVVTYLCAYFLLLSLPASIRFPKASVRSRKELEVRFESFNGSWEVFPDYHGLPTALFDPVHWLDRTYLRPSMWHGYDPTARRELDVWSSPPPRP